MEQKDSNPGIVGVVADIIQVNKEYEIAVELHWVEVFRISLPITKIPQKD